LDVVPPRFQPGAGPNAPVQRLIYREVKIDDRPAVIADEVIVMPGVCVEPVKGASEIDLGDKPLFGQHSEIAVDSPHAQIGELLPQLRIQPVGGRVRVCSPQELENAFTLPASPMSVAVCLSHACRLNRRPD
jgi:hypothetical protein